LLPTRFRLEGISLLNATLVVMMLALFGVPQASAQDTLIDADGDGTSIAVGEHPSLDIVDGRPAVSYYDVINKELRFAINSMPDGLGDWTDVLVDADGDGTSAQVGRDNVLEVIGGKPAITYYDDDNSEIRFAISSDVAGGAGTWTDVSLGTNGFKPSLLEVDGRPAIAYGSFANDIEFAINAAADGSGVWTHVLADGDGQDGTLGIAGAGSPSLSRPSLAILDGKPAIAYHSSANFGEVRYARSTDAAGAAGTWTDVLVDREAGILTNGSGFGIELKALNGLPAIAYTACERKIFNTVANNLYTVGSEFVGGLLCYGRREVRLATNAQSDAAGAWSDVLLSLIFVGTPVVTIDPVRFMNWPPEIDLNSLLGEPSELAFEIFPNRLGAAFVGSGSSPSGRGSIRYATSPSGAAGTWTDIEAVPLVKVFMELSLLEVAGRPAIAYYNFFGENDLDLPWSLRFSRALDDLGTTWGDHEGPGTGGTPTPTVDDIKTIDVDGTDIVLLDGNGTVLIRAAIGSVTPPLIVQGDDRNSTLIVSAAMATLGLDIQFDGGAGFNTLIFEAATVDGVAHTFSNDTDGFVEVDCTSCIGGAVTRITYLNLSPITDNLSASDRTFDFASSLQEAIILSADGDGAVGNGFSFIDSDVGGESVTFANPTTSIAITSGGGGGRKSYTLGALDTPVPGGFTSLTVDGANQADYFLVTPVPDYAISINGGAPTGLCPGDALTFDLSGGAAISLVTEVAGTGSVAFAPPYLPVSFTGMEVIGDISLQVDLNYSTLYATDDLSAANGTALIVTATNTGLGALRCATVTINAAPSTWLSGLTTTPGAPDFTSPVWTVPDMEPGESQTLTLEGFVTPDSPNTVTFTGGSESVLNATEFTASLELSWGFQMPRKAHANSALFFEKTSSVGTYEGLLLGLNQGSPGIDGALWCRIPDSVGPWPPAPILPAAVSGFWRTCSTGLPFPLYVTDLFQDSNDVIWLASWGWDGLYRSEDGGESWTAAPPVGGGGNTIVYTITEGASTGILYASVNNGLVYRSLDAGLNWQQVTSLPAGPSDTPWSLTAHPTVAGVVYAGTFGKGVYYSNSFGHSWQVLDNPLTAANENDALLNLDATGDDFAGHVFDLQFSPDGDFLFSGTGRGVWRADLETNGPTADDFFGGWVQMGPSVALDGGIFITPEVRNLAFSPDGATSDLVGGTWGFGAYLWDNPTVSSTSNFLALREGHVTFVIASPTGDILLGSDSGASETLTAADVVSTGTTGPSSPLPDGYALHENYPNPFTQSTRISFAMPNAATARLAVFDTLGREVAVLVDGPVGAGTHEIVFSMDGLPAGVYVAHLRTPSGALTRTLILL
jgi:hypothetical protein